MPTIENRNVRNYPTDPPPLRQWLGGVYPLPCGCLVTASTTCPHGWMVRVY